MEETKEREVEFFSIFAFHFYYFFPPPFLRSDSHLTMHICLGIEGSANKVGVGIVTEAGDILANPRKT
jgi:hypothetical protein